METSTLSQALEIPSVSVSNIICSCIFCFSLMEGSSLMNLSPVHYHLFLQAVPSTQGSPASSRIPTKVLPLCSMAIMVSSNVIPPVNLPLLLSGPK